MSRLRGRAAVMVGLGVIMLLLAGLAGCSGSAGGAAPTTTSGQQQVAAVLRELVRCARANGLPNMPDLRLDSNGRVSLPPGTPEPPKSVERACRSIWERLPASARGDEERPPADMQALLRYARCMREHGVPEFPDPSADGSFRAWPGLQREGKSPRLLRAMQACRQLSPFPKGGVTFRG